MKDSRIEKLVELITNYSIELNPGEIVLLKGVGEGSIPYVKETYKQCLLRGAKYTEIEFVLGDEARIFGLFANEDQAKYFPKHKFDFAKECAVRIAFFATDNFVDLANVDPKRGLERRKTLHPIQREFLSKKWVLTEVPTQSLAQNAKMSLEEFEDFYFAACITDYKKMSNAQNVLKGVLEKSKIVKIVAKDTNLTFNITGMPAIKCDGKCNLPDGEIFTAPIKSSINGTISFNTPTIYEGKEFNNIFLEFKDGKIIKASAGEMTKDLNQILDTDEGARYTGEFSFGVNKEILQPMREILFDEKIFGSFHLTPGSCYDECDNGNKSAIHWDMVRIMREDYGGGEIFLDDVLIQKNGKFTLPELQGLN